MDLKSPIQYLGGVGPILAKKLAKININTVSDLLSYFPIKYENFSNVVAINQIKLNEISCLKAKLTEIKTSKTRKKGLLITEAWIEDDSGNLKVVWFNQPYLETSLKNNVEYFWAGKIQLGQDGLFLSSPVFEISDQSSKHTARIVPIYQETKDISSRLLRNLIDRALKECKSKIKETLPEEILQKYSLMPSSEAFWQIHFPLAEKNSKEAEKRFAFEELFLIGLFVWKLRLKNSKEKAPALEIKENILRDFSSSLPFALTQAQKKCAWQAIKDMERPRPMSRLLQGDVGSGKTMVALMAILNANKNGYQAALMAPTEILAKQHFQTAARFLGPFKIRIALLTSKQDQIISQKIAYQTKDGYAPELIEISRNKILEKAQKNEIDLLIGTHSLIQEKVKFSNLGIVVVDEQHRFGIKQRAKLIKKTTAKNLAATNNIPHLLSMTATPIPRTLALTIFGDLDLSLLTEMPKGRKKIITKVVPPSERKEIYDFIKKEIKKGGQAFVVCPRIELPDPNKPIITKSKNNRFQTSFALNETKAVKAEYEKLSQEIFPEFKVAMAHGKMKTKEKEKIMKDFKNQKIDILVSTSIIEVGVDIPKATIMLIEGADRFGLAQLHQFRGRVGRNDLQSYCFLFTESSAKPTTQRLSAMQKTESGFKLAEKDLQIRGAGSFYGVKQWGLPDFAMRNLKDLSLVETTRQAAKEILTTSPSLSKFPLLKARVEQFDKILHLE